MPSLESLPGLLRAFVRQHANLTLVLASFAVGMAGFVGYRIDNLYSEGMPPWDASFYTRLARDFYGTVGEVGPYSIQRILPSAIMYHVFRLLFIPPTDSNIIQGFNGLNALLITLIGYLFVLIADELGISLRGKWLGLVALFFNFAVLKHRTYDPVLTDTSAYATGMLLFYCYLKRKHWTLVITTALGAFVWPTILMQGALLLAFPRRDPAAVEAAPASPFYVKAAAVSVSLIISFVVFVALTYLRRSGFSLAVPAYRPAIGLSITITVLYLFYGLKTLFATGEWLSLHHLRAYLANRQAVLRIVLAGLLVILVKLLQSALAAPGGGNYPVALYVQITFWTSVTYPAVFYVAHVMYFGPILLLLLFLWREVCILINRHGLALVLCAFFCFLLSLNSESRQAINFLPMFVVFGVKATEGFGWGRTQYWLLAVTSLLASKAWLTIGPLRTEGMNYRELLLSNQLLFMNNGPAMSTQMYIVQGCAVLVLAWLVYYFCIRHGREGKQHDLHP